MVRCYYCGCKIYTTKSYGTVVHVKRIRMLNMEGRAQFLVTLLYYQLPLNFLLKCSTDAFKNFFFYHKLEVLWFFGILCKILVTYLFIFRCFKLKEKTWFILVPF